MMIKLSGLFLKDAEGKGRISKFGILLGFELVLIVYCIFQYVHPLQQYLYAGYDLTGSHLAYSDDYCYLDENLIPDDGTDPKYLYITTPYVDLPKGSYQVSIVYETDRDCNYSANSKYRTYSVTAGREAANLYCGQKEEMFSFYSPTQIEEYQIHVNYSGSGYLSVKSISIWETNAWKNIRLFYVLLASCLLNMMILGYRKIPMSARNEARLTGFVLLLLTVYTSVPIFSFFMPAGDDLPFHLTRIEAIKTSLLAGQFPNRLSSFWNNGYGYASAVFYGETFLYLPALLRILGFSIQSAYKFYIAAVNFATALVSYYCFRKMFQNNRAALAGCAVYMLAPYRLTCVFLRAAVGEYTAMIFLPLVLCGLFRIYREDTETADNQSGWLPLALGYSGIIQCHILSCVMTGIFAGLFCLVFAFKMMHPKRLWQLIKAGAAIVLLNIWFFLPFADYFLLGYTSEIASRNPLGRMNANAALVSQMITFYQQGVKPSYSIGESFVFPNERNYAVGGFFIVIFFYLCYRLYRGGERSEIVRIGDCSLLFAALSLSMCTLWFPWDRLQQMNGLFRMLTRNIQFPWRFLGISCLLLTVTAICLIRLLQALPNKPLYYAILAVIGTVFLLSADYFMFSYTQNIEWKRYVDEKDIYVDAIGHGEYLPAQTPEDFDADTAVIAGENFEILSERRSAGTCIVEGSNLSEEETYVDIPFLPYKGYMCRDNATNERLAVSLDIPGKVRVRIPPHYHGTFAVAYKEPWYWRISELVSLLTVLAGIVWLVSGNKGKYR